MSDEKKIDLAKVGRDIVSYKDVPNKLDAINITLCGWYGYYSSLMIPLEKQEALFWKKMKEFDSDKPKSDTYVRALWKTTPAGIQMLEYERVLKTIEKQMSTLRTSLTRHATELRNLPK